MVTTRSRAKDQSFQYHQLDERSIPRSSTSRTRDTPARESRPRPSKEKKKNSKGKKSRKDQSSDEESQLSGSFIVHSDEEQSAFSQQSEVSDYTQHSEPQAKVLIRKSGQKKHKQRGEHQQTSGRVVKRVVKGRGAIDECFSDPDNFHVYEEQAKLFSSTLNYTNVQRNNNKYYIIQLLEHDVKKDYFVLLTRYGRVGKQGVVVESKFYSRRAAVQAYHFKLKEKSVKGDYIEVGTEPVQECDMSRILKDKQTSQLQPEVKGVIELIFDVNLFNRQMREVGYDAAKTPLGKLSRESIHKGFEILSDISEELNKKRVDQGVINQLSSQFYSQIPHDFGFQNMRLFIIKDQKTVEEKLSLLQSLIEIQVATSILDNIPAEVNYYDHNYGKLKSQLSIADKEDFDIILKYIKASHAKSHNNYSLNLTSLMEITKQHDETRLADLPNRRLLFHGSRLSNFVGILSQGLRIAPPQAPVTGYMFGKGIYFADSSSKSANYCHCSKENPEGLLLLCEVALGNQKILFNADYKASELPAGINSIKGQGRHQAPSESEMQFRGMKLRMGKLQQKAKYKGQLQYNQFIVYDPSQVRLRYLARVRFEFE